MFIKESSVKYLLGKRSGDLIRLEVCKDFEKEKFRNKIILYNAKYTESKVSLNSDSTILEWRFSNLMIPDVDFFEIFIEMLGPFIRVHDTYIIKNKELIKETIKKPNIYDDIIVYDITLNNYDSFFLNLECEVITSLKESLFILNDNQSIDDSILIPILEHFISNCINSGSNVNLKINLNFIYDLYCNIIPSGIVKKNKFEIMVVFYNYLITHKVKIVDESDNSYIKDDSYYIPTIEIPKDQKGFLNICLLFSNIFKK